MEIEVFQNLLNEKELIMQQLSFINEKIGAMVTFANRELGSKLFSRLKGIFPAEQIDCHGKNEDCVIGEFKEKDKTIIYDLDITDYLLDKYKHDYKQLINRKNKHKMSFSLQYNILSGLFNISFLHHGILYAGLIRDNNLRIATASMLHICRENFDTNNICITNIPDRFKAVKDVFDDYQGYLVTATLCNTT